jgi:hypothetical protein
VRPLLLEIAGDARDRRSEDRKDQQAVEDVVAVFVEERFLIVVQIGERARMHDDVGVFLRRGRADLDFARHRRCQRQPRCEDQLR